MILIKEPMIIKVRDIEEERSIYGTKMGFYEGPGSENWIDWNMFGH